MVVNGNPVAVVGIVTSRARVFNAGIDELLHMRDRLAVLARDRGLCSYTITAIRTVNEALALHAHKRHCAVQLAGMWGVDVPEDPEVSKRGLKAAEDALNIVKAMIGWDQQVVKQVTQCVQ